MTSHVSRTVRAAAVLVAAAITISACSTAPATSTAPGASTAPEASTGGAAEGWSNLEAWSYPVWTVVDGVEAEAVYTPIDKVSKTWKICVLFPHMKNAYWVAGNYGIVTEAKRDHAQVQIFEAGGYTNLATQLNQMDNCISQGYDGIVLGAISADGVGALVDKAVGKGIPVIDLYNGINSKNTTGHAAVSFKRLGQTTAQYLVDNHGSETIKAGFFPGPEGAGWSDDGNAGFSDAAKGTNIDIVLTRRGDTGVNIQQALIENALQSNPEINWIVGSEVAAQAGAVVLRNQRLTETIKVIALDVIPPVYEDIVAGRTVGAATDWTPIQARMAMDMVIRYLEGEKQLAISNAYPKPVMVTKDNLADFKYEEMFAPEDFQVTFKVEP